MLDTVEESIQEHVVLLSICELVVVLDFKTLHEVTKLVLVKLASLALGIGLHDSVETLSESLLSLLIILCLHRSLQEVDNELSSLVDWNVVVSFEMEQESSEDVPVGDAVVQKRIDVVVLQSLLLQLFRLLTESLLLGSFFLVVVLLLVHLQNYSKL